MGLIICSNYQFIINIIKKINSYWYLEGSRLKKMSQSHACYSVCTTQQGIKILNFSHSHKNLRLVFILDKYFNKYFNWIRQAQKQDVCFLWKTLTNQSTWFSPFLTPYCLVGQNMSSSSPHTGKNQTRVFKMASRQFSFSCSFRFWNCEVKILYSYVHKNVFMIFFPWSNSSICLFLVSLSW